MALIRSGDGTQLYYQECGKGKGVVFLAGWALGSDMWESAAGEPAAVCQR